MYRSMTLIVLVLSLSGAAVAQPLGWEDAPEPAPAEDAIETESTSPAPPATEAPAPPAVPAKAAPAKPAPAPAAPEKSKAASTEEPDRERHRHRRWKWRRTERSLSLGAGPARLRVEGLEEPLAAAGYEPLAERAFSIGLNGTKVFDGGLVLGLGGSYTRNESSGGPNDAEVNAHMGHLYGLVGVSLAHTKKWLVYPAAMIGGYKLKLEVDASGSDDFNQVLENPQRGVELEQHGMFVGGVLAIDRRIQWRRDPSRFTSIGLRVGVMESVTGGSWSFAGSSADGGPRALPRVTFAALALGFGRYGANDD